MPTLRNGCLCVVVCLVGCRSLSEWGAGENWTSQDGKCRLGVSCLGFGRSCGDACRRCTLLSFDLRPFRTGYSSGVDEYWTRRTARLRADQALRELRRTTRQRFSAEFNDGFRQAYVDIATGGTGDVPAVPPHHYWNRAYRTDYGHGQVHEWFEGYRIAANEVRAAGTYDTNHVAAAAHVGVHVNELFAQSQGYRPTAHVSAPQPSTASPILRSDIPSALTNETLLIPSLDASPMPADSIEVTPPLQLPAPIRSSTDSGLGVEQTSAQTSSPVGFDFGAIRDIVKMPKIDPHLPSLPSVRDAMPAVHVPKLRPDLSSVRVPTLPSILVPELPAVKVPVPSTFKRMGAALRRE